MEVFTQYRPGTTLIDIWITQDRPDGRYQHIVVGGDRWEWRKLEEAQITPSPTLTLEGNTFRALIANGSDILPPSAATERHLQDATAVRDRLLALVEKSHAPD